VFWCKGARLATCSGALLATCSGALLATCRGALLATCRGALLATCRGALLATLLALGGCGELPQPFRSRPGGDAARLAVPLALRLAVPPPPAALLSDAGASELAKLLADALQTRDVPAVATDSPWPLDWQVEIVAESTGGSVLTGFRLIDADRRPQGATEAKPVSAAAWADAATGTLRDVAEQAAPKLTELLARIEAARKATDPAALAAGPPRIRLGEVSGAPGDGGRSLPARMREMLANQGFVVQDVADGALYGLNAQVTMAAVPGGKQRVEIVWIVSRRDGEELGRIVQLNELPAGRLDRPWGDIAYVVAEEASDGVRTVVANTLEPAAPRPAPPLAVPAAAPGLPAPSVTPRPGG